MIIEATAVKSGGWWAIEIPALAAFSQAKRRSGVLQVAVDMIDDLAGRKLGTTARFEGSRILLESSETAALVALVLRQKRGQAGLTLHEMAKRLGTTSPNAYARYEQGRAMPSVAVLDRLLRAVDGRGLVLG